MNLRRRIFYIFIRFFPVFLLFIFLLPPLLYSGTVPAPTPITINEAAIPIRVDGHLSDWPAARMILLNQKSQVTYGQVYWKGKDDFSGRVFITYDSEYLYVSAIVQKTVGVVNGNEKPSLWNGDCLELFLSTDPLSRIKKRVLKGDYHIGFSPGTNCNNPQMYCFNKQKEIGGGRVIARNSKSGYILEASVPLSFFEGLEIGPGKTTNFNFILDEGGLVSGNRIVQLDLTGDPLSWENPASWETLQWIGKTIVSIPKVETGDLYAGLVQDGTKGLTLLGHKTILGMVTDFNGAPLIGAAVSTWPATTTVITDNNGQFQLKQIKFYDKTLFYARLDGYATSLSAIEKKNEPVTVRLRPLPQGFDSLDRSISPFFYGQTLLLSASNNLSVLTGAIQDWVKPLQLNILRLSGIDLSEKNEDAWLPVLDQFVAYTREIRAEPLIELPIIRDDPDQIAAVVRYCNVVKKYNVQFWTIGSEPDLYADKKGNSDFVDYNVYDYINDFRVIYNAIKRIDPTILVAGPELAWRYTDGEDDWLTPFIQYDGDIVNLASVHRYGSLKGIQCKAQIILDSLRRETTLLRSLKDKVSGNSDVLIPLVVTGGNVCAEATGNTTATIVAATPTLVIASKDKKADKKKSVLSTQNQKLAEDAGPDSFWAALWEAEELGLLMKEKAGMGLFSYLKGSGALDILSDNGPKPNYWALMLLSAPLRGNVITTQIQIPGVSVYATQNPKTKDVCLLIINKSDNYYHPKILLNGKNSDLTVDAGLDQQFDYEIPFYSISVLKLKADRSSGEVFLYTRKMALAKKEPQVSAIKPW